MQITYAEPERNGQEEPDRKRDGDHFIRRVRTEHLRTERAPRNRVRVIALCILAGPQTRTGDGEERGSLGVDDGEHRDVVEDCTDDCASHLHAEGHARRQLAVLAQLQVLQERDALLQRMRAVHCTVHVRNRAARDHVSWIVRVSKRGTCTDGRSH